MKEETKKWIEVGKILSQYPNRELKCPVCNKGILEVKDISSKSNPELCERIMRCPTCGAWNTMRLKKTIG